MGGINLWLPGSDVTLPRNQLGMSRGRGREKSLYLHEDGLSSRENEDDVASPRSLEVPRDAVPDAAILRVDPEDPSLPRLLMALPAGGVDPGREGVLGHKVEVIVILGPVHVPHLELELQGGGGTLENDRAIPR